MREDQVLLGTAERHVEGEVLSTDVEVTAGHRVKVEDQSTIGLDVPLQSLLMLDDRQVKGHVPTFALRGFKQVEEVFDQFSVVRLVVHGARVPY